jgi:O-antigen ligase
MINGMQAEQLVCGRLAFWCAFGAALATIFSISTSQVLLGAGALLLVVCRMPLSFPPIAWPLALFFVGTFLSLAVSSDIAAGLPQMRKLFVFLTLPLIASTFRTLEQAHWLIYAWISASVASALLSLWQFSVRWQISGTSGADFYATYVSDRITGFMSHWMTFSGLQLAVLSFAVSLILFGVIGRWTRVAIWTACVVMLSSIVLSLTRGVWMATAVASLYLLWQWKRWTVVVLPFAGVLLFLLGPDVVRSRITSFTKPRGDLDSNQHRIVTFRTGLAMIRTHPWFGLGPEVVGKDFDKYIPEDIPRPLPRGWYGHLHNIYLQYAAERGLPTLIMVLWLFAAALIRWFLAVQRLPRSHPATCLLHGSIAALLGTLVIGTVEHNLGDSEVLLITLTVLCLGYLGAQAASPDTAHKTQPQLPSPCLSKRSLKTA